MIGTTVTVLIEGISKKRDNEISGRTENNRIVNLPGTKKHIGHIVNVVITEKLENSLRGRIQNDDVHKHFEDVKYTQQSAEYAAG